MGSAAAAILQALRRNLGAKHSVLTRKRSMRWTKHRAHRAKRIALEADASTAPDLAAEILPS
jgi:hypothetical protein